VQNSIRLNPTSLLKPKGSKGSKGLSVALVHGVPVGAGGLGLQAATALCGLVDRNHTIHANGPGLAPGWPFDQPPPRAVWHCRAFTPLIPSEYTPYRWLKGRLQYKVDTAIGSWAAREIARQRPSCCYLFTQVALESLQWARASGVPTVLDNPNGHIAGFREVYCAEARRWSRTGYFGHPTPAMVARVEEEYRLADRIRVSSEWAKRSLVERGVPESKIMVIRQIVNLDRFRPPLDFPPPEGPLRLCYVGSLDFRKGFVYLLKALQSFPPGQIRLTIVGASGTRSCKKLYQRESAGLDVSLTSGDPLRALQSSELFILPSLEDGFGFVIGEAMACGLPVIVTDQCGGAELVTQGDSGWVVPSRNACAIAEVLRLSLAKRSHLREMGRAARASAERFLAPSNTNRLHDWLYSGN
jgi:glycosyltransferase involved in cell wall biosynthesis